MLLSIWITNDCNMNCDYCYEAAKGHKKMPLSYTSNVLEFIKTVLPLTDTNNLYIKFFGGEPVLNLEFIKNFINEVKKCDLPITTPIQYSITTNGTLLTKTVVEYLLLNKIDCVLSVDGYPEIHDLHRKMKNGEGSWKYIESNIKYLLEQQPDTYARMTYTPHTGKYLFESLIFLVHFGFKKIKLIPDYFDPGWNEENFELLKPQLKDVEDFRKAHTEIEIATDDYNVKKGYIGCGGGYSAFSIDVKGDVYPCTYAVEFEDFKLGSIFDIENYKIRKHIADHEKRESCKGCKYFKICLSGRCIYMNYKISRDFYKPSGFFCEYQKNTYRLMGI